MQSVLAFAHCLVAERADSHQFCLGGECYISQGRAKKEVPHTADTFIKGHKGLIVNGGHKI